MLRRLALTAVACLSALAAAPAATAAPAGPVATAVPAATPLPAPVAQPGHRLPNPWVRDRLTITVADSGIPGADGTHRLVCAPAGGRTPRRSRPATGWTSSRPTGGRRSRPFPAP